MRLEIQTSLFIYHRATPIKVVSLLQLLGVHQGKQVFFELVDKQSRLERLVQLVSIERVSSDAFNVYLGVYVVKMLVQIYKEKRMRGSRKSNGVMMSFEPHLVCCCGC